jgi:hypothetical protein
MAYRNGVKIDSRAQKLLDKGRPPAVVVNPKENLKGFAAKNRKERRSLLAVSRKQQRKMAFDANRRFLQHKARDQKAARKALLANIR